MVMDLTPEQIRHIQKMELEEELAKKPLKQGQWASEGQTMIIKTSPPVEPMVEAVLILKEIRDLLKGMQS